MKKHLFITFVCLACLLGASTTNAYINYGLGVKTCGTWLSKRRNNDHYDMAQWMLGFVSAAGYYGKKLKKSEGQAFIVWMDNFCTQNPLSEFGDGVKQLTRELSK